MYEGVCIYKNGLDIPVIKMYKEIYSGKILQVEYYNFLIDVFLLNSKKFIQSFPKESKHILYFLPFDYKNDIEYNINNWKNIVKESFKTLS